MSLQGEAGREGIGSGAYTSPLQTWHGIPAVPALGRNPLVCHPQRAPGRGSLAYGVSNFLVTSGMLAEQWRSRERAGWLITPRCLQPPAELYCFMQMSS